MENLPEGLRQRGYTNPYSKWHWNTLSKSCYMLDLDSIEVRNNKPVAIIELRTTPTPLNNWHKEIVLFIADKLDIPAYLVFYANDFSTFSVRDLKTDEVTNMTEQEYIQFVEKLI